jgi:hypothetical protein
MRKELEAMHPDARDMVTDFLRLLHTTVEDRNRFAHLLMDHNYEPTEQFQGGNLDVLVISATPRIGDMTIEDANEAWKGA